MRKLSSILNSAFVETVRRIFTMRFLGREIWGQCEGVIAKVGEFFEAAA